MKDVLLFCIIWASLLAIGALGGFIAGMKATPESLRYVGAFVMSLVAFATSGGLGVLGRESKAIAVICSGICAMFALCMIASVGIWITKS
jgi:hypothetical protein